tara:strand:- start:472 stop:1305 length:834 start_codon:yes stop_codon:yes gene_type:complete
MKKILNLLYRLFFTLTFYLANNKKIKLFGKKIFFNFSRKYFHLGDELFFWPTILWLESKNYNIEINSSKLNLKKFPKISSNKDGVFLIRPDCFIPGTTSIDVWSGNSKISKDIFFNSCNFLNLKVSDTDYLSACSLLKNLLANIKLDVTMRHDFEHTHFNILSTEIDSGAWRYFGALKRSANNLCNKIDSKFINVHVGKNLIMDSMAVDIYKDLGGLTNVHQLIALLSNKNIKNVYTFDTLIYHIAFLFNHNIICEPRKWIHQRKSVHIKKRFIPAF